MELGLSGLASGFDWRSMVDQLVEIERAPQRLLLTEQAAINRRNDAYGTIQTQLNSLMAKAKGLTEASLLDSRAASSSAETVATASATTSATLGAYRFNVTQLATSSTHRGTSDIGNSLSATNDVSGVVLNSAGFPTAVTAGSFTLNGKRVDVATTDTLQQVFDNISAATLGNVTASYDASADKITLFSNNGSPIILGSANDTSNFLNVAKLSNNATDTVVSGTRLGGIRTSATLNASNLRTTVTGTAGAGSFKLNGVSISYNTTTDTLNDVIARINNSTAGVTASYDPVNDRFSLANKVTGDLGIAMEDVTGNFLSATGISGGTLDRGRDLLYTLNDGVDVLRSKSNTIDEASSGIAGLTVGVLATGVATIEVKNDVSKIKKAIQDFVSDYNKSQSIIDSFTASTTDSKGVVTAGILSSDRDAAELSSRLRSLVNSQVTGLTGTVDLLSDLGYKSNGEDNSLALADEATLDNALASNLASVRDFLSKTTTGMASRLNDYLIKTTDDDGTIDDKQTVLGAQSISIDNQIADLERQVQARRTAMISSFVTMEQAQARINQQLQYINQRFGSRSA